MALSSSRSYLARSAFRLSLLRDNRTAQFERTQTQTQFVRSFCQSSNDNLIGGAAIAKSNLRLVSHLDEMRLFLLFCVFLYLCKLRELVAVWALLITISNLGFVADLDCWQKEKDEVARMIESLKNLGGRYLKVEILKDDDIQHGECVIEMHPHTYEVMKVWHKQEEILRILTDIYVTAEVKLTLSSSGLLTCLYEHGPRNTWSAVVGRMKGREGTSSDELKKVESWLDNVEPLAKDIYKVLVGYQKLKKSEENPLEVFPYDWGSILIKLSKLRLKWRAIASLEHANVLDDIGMTELDEMETLIKELHEIVVVQQLLQQKI